MDVIKAKNTLKVASRILEKLPITWWMSAGTALGAYRDKFSNEFLSKDTDIDIGILGYGRKDMLINEFDEDMNLWQCNYVDGDKLVQMAFLHDGIILDFYFFVPEGENAVNYNYSGKMVKPLRMVEKPGKINVLGQDFPIPSPIEDYLEVRFGKDWRIPREHTVWMNNAANLITS